jgi:hypothetical protein
MTTLKEVIAQAKKYADLKVEIDVLKATLSEKNAELNELKFKVIPDLFQELEIDSIGVSDQANVVIKPYVHAVIKTDAPNKAQALGWFVSHGYEDLIKTTITIEFGRGQYDELLVVQQFLDEQGFSYIRDQNIHWATLTAFVKEQLKNGKDTLPLDLIGATIGSVASVESK